jgi:hypothetical protein
MGKRTTLQSGYSNHYLKFHPDDGEVDRHGSAVAWFTCSSVIASHIGFL